MSKPKLVGITGGIGSGKSTVCKVFEVLGARTYYADDRAKWLMENDPDLTEKIKGIFGPATYKEGRLDRNELARKVFEQKDLLEQLNAAVHPAVAQDFKRWITKHENEKILLKEAALLFETGSYRDLDVTILVTAKEDTRIRRVLERDRQRTEKNIRDIMDKQLPDEKKRPLADEVINNDGTTSVIRQVLDVYGRMI